MSDLLLQYQSKHRSVYLLLYSVSSQSLYMDSELRFNDIKF